MLVFPSEAAATQDAAFEHWARRGVGHLRHSHGFLARLHGILAKEHPLLLAERFGTRDYGRIYSTSQLVTVIGLAGAPPLIGVLYDASGGYIVPFLVAAVLSLVGLAVLAVFGRGRR